MTPPKQNAKKGGRDEGGGDRQKEERRRAREGGREGEGVGRRGGEGLRLETASCDNNVFHFQQPARWHPLC